MNNKINEASSSNNIMANVWDKLWKTHIPSKIKHFCWKAINETLPTRQIYNLKNRDVETSLDCPICLHSIETTDHILFNCSRARDIWRIIAKRVYLEEDFNNSFVDKWIKINANSFMDEIDLVATACWAI